MKGGIAWFARNPVAANLMMIFIIVSGVIATSSVKEEIFPEIELDRVSIQIPYLGAAPEEVEAGVVIRVEEAIQGVDGIKEIQSTASEGNASIMVELELGADARRVVEEIKNQVDSITTFPIETEQPIIREMIARNQVTDISISGATDVFTLKAIAEQVRDELSVLPEITQVDIVSAPPYEISIEVSEVALRRHGMTFDQVADAVRRSSLDLPGGSVRTDGGEILLRTIGQAYRGDEYEDLVLWTRADGTRLRLGDVATVVDGFAETDQEARFDHDTTVMVSVFRTGDQSALDIAAAVHRYIEDAQARVPEGISLTIWQDQAEILNDRLTLMLRNGATGFVLVFIVLALFLQFRLAFWVSLGIPISFLGAIALMPALDVSANVISLFAFILVLGIVVDDAIIVGENIFRHQENHGDALRELHRGRAGDRQAGGLRGPDDGGGVHAVDVRAGHDGEDLPGHSPRRHSLSALLAGRVARHPARPSRPHAPGAAHVQPVAPVPAVLRQRAQGLRAARSISLCSSPRSAGGTSPPPSGSRF